MAKVLKITKADKTIHVIPITNRSFYQGWNHRQPQSKQVQIEEIDEKDAKDLPFWDETAVTPLEAVQESKKLKDVVAAQDNYIKELEARLNGGDILPHGQNGPINRVGGDPATATEGAEHTGINNPENVSAIEEAKPKKTSK